MLDRKKICLILALASYDKWFRKSCFWWPQDFNYLADASNHGHHSHIAHIKFEKAYRPQPTWFQWMFVNWLCITWFKNIITIPFHYLAGLLLEICVTIVLVISWTHCRKFLFLAWFSKLEFWSGYGSLIVLFSRFINIVQFSTVHMQVSVSNKIKTLK